MRMEVSRLPEVMARNKARQENELRLEELEQLRRNHLELDRLAAKVEQLRRMQAQRSSEERRKDGEQIHLLETQNSRLRTELAQMKAAPETAEARLSVDRTQLEQIARFFYSYARNNSGRYPSNFSELRYYLPASVFPTIETNRFEILWGGANAEPDPAQQALVRTRVEDQQNTRFYLFADGHLETRSAP